MSLILGIGIVKSFADDNTTGTAATQESHIVSNVYTTPTNNKDALSHESDLQTIETQEPVQSQPVKPAHSQSVPSDQVGNSINQTTTYKETRTTYKTKNTKSGKVTVKQQVIRTKTIKAGKSTGAQKSTIPNSGPRGNDIVDSSPTKSASSTNVQPASSNSNLTNDKTSSPSQAPNTGTTTSNVDQDTTNAQNENIELQPALTKSQIGVNETQQFYDFTGAISNIVGQGTAILNSVYQFILTLKNLL